MIDLDEQILSFVVSFSYGIVCSLLYINFNSFFYYNGAIYNFFNSFLFCLCVIIIYFKLLYIISDGVCNIYFILVFFLSFLTFCKIFTNKMSK
jgi:hypothetical protein